MADPEIITLSSSPPRRQHSSVFTYTVSSSPRLPSPSQLIGNESQLNAGGIAAPILTAPYSSFTSASHLLGNDSPDKEIETVQSCEALGAATHDTTINPTVKPKAVRKARAPRADQNVDAIPKKSRTLKAEHHDDASTVTPVKAKSGDADGGVAKKPRKKKGEEKDETKVKAPRKSRAKKVETDLGRDSAPNVKPTKKARTKKDNIAIQTTIPKGKVTKTSTGSASGKTSKKKGDVVSSYFTPAIPDDQDPSMVIIDDGLLLQQAVRRRLDWTPPKATAGRVDILGTRLELCSVGNGQLLIESAEKGKGFSDLFGSFGYCKAGAPTEPCRIPVSVNTKKRKLIELVKTNDSAVLEQSPVPKAKPVRRKPRTITEIATSAYAIQKEDAGDAAPLLQYFSAANPEVAAESMMIKSSKRPPKLRNRSPIKKASKTSKTKKTVAQEQFLLSPESALQQAKKQEFVFGTSSQLAREDSPTLLRDLHQAMLASNRIDDDPFAEPGDVLATTRAKANSKRSMWAAASYGNDEDSMIIDIVDLANSPEMSKVQTCEGNLLTSIQLATDSLPKAQHDAGWFELGEDGPKAIQTTNKKMPIPYDLGSADASTTLQLPSDTLSSNKTLVDSSQILTSKPSENTAPPKKLGRPKRGKEASKPDYQSYTTVQLAKEIASYHFKPIKSRDHMITMLEKCWESKQRSALGDLGTNTKLSLSPTKQLQQETECDLPDATISPQRSRGRPRKKEVLSANLPTTKLKSNEKQSTEEIEHILSESDTALVLRQTPKKRQWVPPFPEEISDSESPITPSPPRRKTSQVQPPTLRIQISNPEASVDTDPLSPTAQQTLLHKHITQAVTSAPRSNNPQLPSWHEKILLYDPILLEDLTVWLNTGALQSTGWDGEVEPKEVKKWCWDRSICCLWRENLKGGSKARW